MPSNALVGRANRKKALFKKAVIHLGDRCFCVSYGSCSGPSSLLLRVLFCFRFVVILSSSRLVRLSLRRHRSPKSFLPRLSVPRFSELFLVPSRALCPSRDRASTSRSRVRRSTTVNIVLHKLRTIDSKYMCTYLSQ